MILSKLIGAYSVDLLPIDATANSITFSASAHSVVRWYITINKTHTGLTLSHHKGDFENSIISPMKIKTRGFESLDKFAKSSAISLMKRESLKTKHGVR